MLKLARYKNKDPQDDRENLPSGAAQVTSIHEKVTNKTHKGFCQTSGVCVTWQAVEVPVTCGSSPRPYRG